MKLDTLILGLDLGTSGLRACVVKRSTCISSAQTNETCLAEIHIPMPIPYKQPQTSQQDPIIWQQALENCLDQLAQQGWSQQIKQIIADATSSTVLLTDTKGKPVSPALMYDDKRALVQAAILSEKLAENSGALGANSSLAKALWLAQTYGKNHLRLLHQIDWLNFQLCGQFTATDENNLLKLGYDSINQVWPSIVRDKMPYPLPESVSPGSLLGFVSPQLIKQWGFTPDCQVHAGTTDSIAAFLASGASRLGDAVTALGSTLAIKLLSNTPIFASDYGIYSHKLKHQWLVGGASNAGGAVLLHYFSLEQIKSLIPKLDVSKPTGLPCYPLIQPGERFPIANPDFKPIIPEKQPAPILLQALIEGLVDIEVKAYQKLEQLGAPKVKRLFGVGGGSQNQVWSDLRTQRLSAKLMNPISQSAAFGVTRLI